MDVALLAANHVQSTQLAVPKIALQFQHLFICWFDCLPTYHMHNNDMYIAAVYDFVWMETKCSAPDNKSCSNTIPHIIKIDQMSTKIDRTLLGHTLHFKILL